MWWSGCSRRRCAPCSGRPGGHGSPSRRRSCRKGSRLPGRTRPGTRPRLCDHSHVHPCNMLMGSTWSGPKLCCERCNKSLGVKPIETPTADTKTSAADVLDMSQAACAHHDNVHRSSACCHAHALSWSTTVGTRAQQTHARWKRSTEAGKAAAETHRCFPPVLVAPISAPVTPAPHDSPSAATLQAPTPSAAQQRRHRRL